MKYYTQKPKKGSRFTIKIKKIPSWLLVIITILIVFNTFVYLFEKRILPAVLSIAEITMKSEAIRVINEESVKVYSDNFKYDDIIKIEKDSDGNITMIRSDTVKQNYLASQVVLNCDDRLSELGELGTKVPLGYITNNLFFYQMGPNITVKMKQIGNINTSYESIFESAGINQTRHKIYLNVSAKLRVIVPLSSKDVDISCQIPISETIIVGKIPETAINMGGQ
jgi:sporulation protein YunB